MRHLVIATLLLSGCQASDPFSRRYDIFFPSPKGGVIAESTPTGGYSQRGYYDGLLFKRSTPQERESWRDLHRDFYEAFYGDAAAMERFLHSEYRGEAGEFGETWTTHCLVLALKYGDAQFTDIVASEDTETKQAVANSLYNFLPNLRDYDHLRLLLFTYQQQNG
jgi:hypothetical protein